MTLDECINKKEITEYLDVLDSKFQGNKVEFKIGDTYNRLTIVKLIRYIEGKTKRKGCICKCSCGNYVGPIRLQSLLNGDSVSCGCYQREIHSDQMKERNFKHGFASREDREHLYVLWGAMKDRVTNRNRKDSKWYSDKCLEFYEEWNDYTKFREWSLANGYEEGLSIDRIDNSIGYRPDNCRWIPLKDQNKNKTTNRLITYKGETKILADWCRELNISDKLVSSRLSRGWSELEALELI